MRYSFGLMMLFVGLAYGQYFERSGYSGVGIPFFQAELYRGFDEDLRQIRLHITAMILYDDLTFIKSDTSGYDADFEWIIAVYNEHDRVVFSRTINKKFNVKEYERTNTRNEKIALKEEISLPAGKYSILLRTLDLISNKTAQRKIEMELPAFADKELSLSGIMFLHSVTLDSAGLITDFTPTFSNNFSLRGGEFFVYFDLYSKKTDVPATIRYILKAEKEDPEVDTLITTIVKDNISTHILKFKKKRFKKNRYDLKVRVEAEGKKVENQTSFSFFWSEVPTTVEDIDLALQQMTYILNSDSLKKYEKSTLPEKQKFFLRFWAERDPNPATSKNELMDEYFHRVNYSNKQFSSFNMKGWLSDRGRILIKFGTPDDIERHPFEINSRPFEIWRYYSIRKTFLFEDYSGFGDYRLHPAYLNIEYE